MISKLSIFSAAMITLITLSGCSPADTARNAGGTASAAVQPTVAKSSPTEASGGREDIQKKIMDGFKTLQLGKARLPEIAAYIDKNMKEASKENVSLMADGFEKMQKEYLPAMEEKFGSDAVQKELMKIFKPGFDIGKIGAITDAGVKALLAEARDSGYKIETAEGMYFPIIDYNFYKKYSANVTADMKEYFDIMAIESDNVPAKDAAIVISWDEVIKRALRQEKFMADYGGSLKLREVKDLYKKYMSFVLLGSNNTPLFSYDGKKMNPKAQTAYTSAVANAGDSKLLKMLGSFMDLVKKNNYTLTDEVDKYRKAQLESVK